MSSGNLEKYRSRNPVVRFLVGRFLDRIDGCVAGIAPRGIVDLACGEGIVAERLMRAAATDYVGLDRDGEALAEARRVNPTLKFIEADVRTAPIPGGAGDLVLCLEFLEHLEDPETLVARLAGLPHRGVIFSVPWEPWFRLGNLLRGRHVTRFGNSPGHLQAFGPRSFRALIDRHFRHVTGFACFPWIVAVASNTDPVPAAPARC